MHDPLEDFIKNNRKAFDTQEMSKGWEGIEPHVLPQKFRIGGMKKVWWAVAAVSLICCATSFFFLSREDGSATPVTQSEGRPLKNDQYNQQMFLFVKLIEEKQVELKQVGRNHPWLYKQFIKDINSLDSSFSKLKAELPANPNQEMLVEAMIKNLQIQLELLNRQLDIIRQIKQKSIKYESKTI